jgi:hypothetical protein
MKEINNNFGNRQMSGKNFGNCREEILIPKLIGKKKLKKPI